MDVLPSGSIFHELKVVHDTGYFDGKVSPEERWQQVRDKKGAISQCGKCHNFLSLRFYVKIIILGILGVQNLPF